MRDIDLALLTQSRAHELPGVTQTHPFGPQTEVFKVCEKVFLLLGSTSAQRLVTLKSRPADSVVLRQAYSELFPGYHMNKRHWISFAADSALDPELVADLVTESYLLVVESLPRRIQPVNPHTFGQRDAH